MLNSLYKQATGRTGRKSHIFTDLRFIESFKEKDIQTYYNLRLMRVVCKALSRSYVSNRINDDTLLKVLTKIRSCTMELTPQIVKTIEQSLLHTGQFKPGQWVQFKKGSSNAKEFNPKKDGGLWILGVKGN